MSNHLADRYRMAYERSERSRTEWVDATIEMAVTLAEARGQFPDNRAFSIWLAENELDFHSHQDRAALINMASDAELARAVLAETNRTSPETIWSQEIKPMTTLTKVRKNDPVPTEPPIDATSPPQEPETDEADETKVANLDVGVGEVPKTKSAVRARLDHKRVDLSAAAHSFREIRYVF